MMGYFPGMDELSVPCLDLPKLFLSGNGLWMDWNEEEGGYDIIKPHNNVNYVIVTLPKEVVLSDTLEAIESVESVLSLNSCFGENLLLQ